MNYRFLDVTAIKIMWLNALGGDEFDKADAHLIAKYFSGALADLAANPHDAYYDVQASIAELGYYQTALTKMEGGRPLPPL